MIVRYRYNTTASDTITSIEINSFGVPDTMSCINQFMPDVKEIAKHLFQTMTVTGRLFQGLPSNYS